MRTVQLGQSGLTSSALGFGCSALLGRSGRKDSLRALAKAWDAGVTFYDTARSYGYGESEALLGEFLSSRRHQAIVSTKFGISASSPQLWKRMAKPVARALGTLAPGSRKLLRRFAAAQFSHDQFTVEVLKLSIHESLRKLRTDYVDFLFLHDAPASALGKDDLIAALEDLVIQGKVRAVGISSHPKEIGLALRHGQRALNALQCPVNMFDYPSPALLEAIRDSGWAAIANHPFGGVLRAEQSRALLRKISVSPLTPILLREKLATVDDTTFADVVLNLVLKCPGIHVVVPAMMKPDHIAKNIDAIQNSRFTYSELDWLAASISGALVEA